MPRKLRNRKPGRREPNGRLSRKQADVSQRNEMTEAEAKSVVIAARIRQGVPLWAVDLVDAGRPNAGTTHGRMLLQKEIDRDQWDAAEWYIARRMEWLRAIQAKGETIECEAPSRGPADDGKYVSWCKDVRATYQGILDELQRVSVETRSPVIAAVEMVLIRDTYMPHMVGDFRLGMNALHRSFIVRRKAA